MAFRIEFERQAERELSRLGSDDARRVLRFLHDRLARLDDPRQIGEALKGAQLGGFWKYRVGDIRVIAHIEDRQVRILIVRIGNRREVYR
ncbi:type II toxin-antitoxin system RelE family toxin [Methylobrevis albus]|uniref:Type II toxin-antitoxin system RelE/ParE family toxin n=1 Tax=Methylobrevis albus TaxID=2793297 RepID=A0A931MY28_9HYPH|nr:type II toxin-antitoxin system RelE/ParE family toxin [Methylobrevis albus]MBH0237580.1 type II toxin-antitoxin system RelE/ParE family toxin [Methylobrevis albus]